MSKTCHRTVADIMTIAALSCCGARRMSSVTSTIVPRRPLPLAQLALSATGSFLLPMDTRLFVATESGKFSFLALAKTCLYK